MAATSGYAASAVTDETPSTIRPSHQHTLSSTSILSAASGNEDIFSSITGFEDFGADDDLCFDMDDESRDEVRDLNSTDANGKGKKSKRLGANTAEKKATHNAVERARRESLNTRFLVLADMLPGMVNVKRASKAAIVNKSIDLIRELRKTETRLSKENETIKAELEALRAEAASNAVKMGSLPAMLPSGQNAVGGPMPFGAMGMMGFHPHAQAQAQMYQNQMQQMGYPAFPPIVPMMAPTMPQQQGSPSSVNELRPSSAVENGSPAPCFSQQSQQAASQFAVYPTAGINGMFDLFNTTQTAGQIDASVRSGSASPSTSDIPALPNPALNPAAYSGFGYNPFDLTGLTGNNVNSSPQTQMPSTFAQRKDSLAPSAAGSGGSGSQAAASPSSCTSSPPSSHSVPTPANTYSPLPLPPVLGEAHQATTSSSILSQNTSTNSVSNNPAYAAFDASSDPALLAASFAPRDLAKAQSDLQSFIQFQQSQARMSQAMLNFQNMMPQQQAQQFVGQLKDDPTFVYPSFGGVQAAFSGADMAPYFQSHWSAMLSAGAGAN